MPVLITGGAGYIGSVTVGELLSRGRKVRVFDRFVSGINPFVPNTPNLEVVEGDILRFDPAVLEDVDSVIHLAGLSNDSTAEYNPAANVRLNTDGARLVAEACKAKGVARFVFASSCSVYDKRQTGEDFLQTEDTPVDPKAAYGLSKVAAEKALQGMTDKRFQPIILRQATVCGWSPRMRYDLVVNTFVKSAFQTGKLTVHCGGTMWRPLIDVTDLAKCFVACVDAPLNQIGGQIFNVSQRNFQIIELAHHVKNSLKNFVDVEIVVEHGNQVVRDYRVSNEKMTKLLGFTPETTVEDSARNMAQKVMSGCTADFNNPKYYNIQWLELLVEAEQILKRIGSVF
jgi:nucleoside-diphosphate-sugar epimerase